MLAVAACSSSGSGSTAQTPSSPSQPLASVASAARHAVVPDACALLSTAEVGQALGATVLEGQATDLAAPLAGRGCTWTANTQPLRAFVLNVRTDASITKPGLDAASLFALTKKTLGTAQKFVPLEGVGDAAVIGETFASVLEGDVKLDGNVRDGLVVNNQAALRTLMAAAAAHLA
jgi:hypothetical protein